MNDTSAPARPAHAAPRAATLLDGHIIEIIGGAGDGAWRCGQNFAAIALRMGNGIWMTEIVPADLRKTVHTGAGASGIRVRLGRQRVSNGGDLTDLVLAFNAQALLGRVRAGEIKPGATLLLEGQAAQDPDPAVAAAHRQAVATLRADGFDVHELPLLARCQQLVSDPRKGMNMFVLGLLCQLYSLDPTLVREQVARLFGGTDFKVIQSNVALVEAGAAWGEARLPFRYSLPATRPTEPQIVVDGNTAIALGVMASGMDICTLVADAPAAMPSPGLGEMFEKVGGLVHPAEDALAAAAFALGASYAGKCAVTITSGAGYALQQQVIDLAARAEIPLVVIKLQGGGQSIEAEQGDGLAAVFGSQGEAPKVVMVASGIEDAFDSVITARKIAETFGMVVVLLADASLARAQQAFPRPQFTDDGLAPPVDQTPVPPGVRPYDWDPVTGLSRRQQPGRPGGMHILTGLPHGRDGQPTLDPATLQEGQRARSLKLAALQHTLKPPTVFGAPHGDMLLIGSGGTLGAIEEAVTRLRAEGLAVSALHLRFIQPLPSGLREILARFKHAMTIEANWADRVEDEVINADNRRHSALALMLRSRFLLDIEGWSQAGGAPIRPADICHAVRSALLKKGPTP